MQRIAIKRIYEAASKDDGFRVLVDRVWPRGVSKEDAAIDHWAKDLAPSAELRKWFGHDPDKWNEFRRRCRKELVDSGTELDSLAGQVGHGPMTLLFAATDTERNQAVVKDVLEDRS